MKNKPEPTKSELEILSILWDREEASVREVFEIIKTRKKTSYTTILKLMQIMYEKQLVYRNEEQRAHVYRARVKQTETGRRMLNDLMNKVFEGSAFKLVQQILQTEETSPDEMRKIREMIDRAEKEAQNK